MQKYVFLALVWSCVLLSGRSSFAQAKTYQFEQIDSLQKVEKRNIVVFIHTDWCKYCQAMKQTTFKQSDIVKMLNERYYFIHLNAEERRDIVFSNQTFKYKPTGSSTGTNDLAVQLGTIDATLSYPVLSILNSANEIIFQHPNYVKYNDLIGILDKLK